MPPAAPMPPAALAPSTTFPTPQGQWIVVSIAVLVVATALFVVSAVMIGTKLYDQFSHTPNVAVPGTTSIHLEPGDYLLWQESGPASGSSGAGFGAIYGNQITPDEVSVTSPGGQRLPLSLPSGTETITTGSFTYTGVIGFHASSSGYYQIVVHGHSSTQVILALSWGGLFSSIAGWIGGAIVACVLGAGGISLLIVMLVRRGDAKRRAQRSAYIRY